MQSMTHAASTRRHLSRHERQRQARAEAFSRRTAMTPIVLPPVRLATEVERLLGGDAQSRAPLVGFGGRHRRPRSGQSRPRSSS